MIALTIDWKDTMSWQSRFTIIIDKLFLPPKRTCYVPCQYLLSHSELRSGSTNSAWFLRHGRINICYATVVIVPLFPKQFKVGMRDLLNGETSGALGTLSQRRN